MVSKEFESLSMQLSKLKLQLLGVEVQIEDYYLLANRAEISDKLLEFYIKISNASYATQRHRKRRISFLSHIQKLDLKKNFFEAETIPGITDQESLKRVLTEYDLIDLVVKIDSHWVYLQIDKKRNKVYFYNSESLSTSQQAKRNQLTELILKNLLGVEISYFGEKISFKAGRWVHETQTIQILSYIYKDVLKKNSIRKGDVSELKAYFMFIFQVSLMLDLGAKAVSRLDSEASKSSLRAQKSAQKGQKRSVISISTKSLKNSKKSTMGHQKSSRHQRMRSAVENQSKKSKKAQTILSLMLSTKKAFLEDHGLAALAGDDNQRAVYNPSELGLPPSAPRLRLPIKPTKQPKASKRTKNPNLSNLQQLPTAQRYIVNPKLLQQQINAHQIRNYHKALVLPELKKYSKDLRRYKDRAQNLEIEALRRRRLDQDVPGQLEEYLNNLRRNYEVLDLKIAGIDDLVQLPPLPGAKGSNPNHQSLPFLSGIPGAQKSRKQSAGGKRGQSRGFRASSGFNTSKSVIHKDIRPRLNYRMFEPLEHLDPADEINRRVDRLNKQRKREFQLKMRIRQQKIEELRDMQRNLPLPPELPQIYSFVNHTDYPFDFNMHSHNLIQKKQEEVDKDRARKINEVYVMPLKSSILKLRSLRDEIGALKAKRDKKRLDIQEANDKFKEADDSEEKEDWMDILVAHKNQYDREVELVQKKKGEIEELRTVITGLKNQLIGILKDMAMKEDIADPDHIFDFPENNKVQHLTKEVNLELQAAFEDIRQRELAKQEEELRKKREREAALRAAMESSSSSGSYTGSSYTGSSSRS